MESLQEFLERIFFLIEEEKTLNLLSTSYFHLIPLQWNFDVSGAAAAALATTKQQI